MSHIHVDEAKPHGHTDRHDHEHRHDHMDRHDHEYHRDHTSIYDSIKHIDHEDHNHHEDHGHHHGHGHHHDHTHGMAKKTLRTAFFLTCVILLASFIGGLLAHSLALLSDATHTLTDLLAIGLAWFAAEQAERPPNEYKTFGYHRVGILAAFVNAITLIVIAVIIFWEAIQRLQHPEPVQPFIIFVSATIAIAINLFIGFGLRKEDHNLNVRAAALHVFGDVGVSVAVIVAGGIVLLTGWTFVDPLLSIAVALWLAWGTRHIIRETVDILLESVPGHISLKDLVADMQKVAGVEAVHDLHVWNVSSGISALSCHVLIDDLSQSESTRILYALNDLFRGKKYRIDHATIQFECSQSQVFVCENGCCFKSSNPQVHDHSHEHVHDHSCGHDHSHDQTCEHGHERVVVGYANSYANGEFVKRESRSRIRTVRVRLEPLDERVSQPV
jgi:cobalt-zinc-cadmium efflux system protein